MKVYLTVLLAVVMTCCALAGCAEAAPVVEEENYGDDYVEPQGQTTVVGSNPVNVFDAGQNVNGGQNVGSGSTNVSMELDGQSVIVGDF